MKALPYLFGWFIGCLVFAASTFGQHRYFDHEPLEKALQDSMITTVLWGTFMYFVGRHHLNKRNQK